MTTTDKSEGFRQIDANRRKMLVRLASNAPHLKIRRDSQVPQGFILHDPDMPGAFDRVNAKGECTCGAYGIWGRCKHSATVELRYGRLT